MRVSSRTITTNQAAEPQTNNPTLNQYDVGLKKNPSTLGAVYTAPQKITTYTTNPLHKPIGEQLVDYIDSQLGDEAAKTCTMFINGVAKYVFQPCKAQIIADFLSDFNVIVKVGIAHVVSALDLSHVSELKAGSSIHISGVGLGGTKKAKAALSKAPPAKRPVRTTKMVVVQKKKNKPKTAKMGKSMIPGGKQSAVADVAQYALARLKPFDQKAYGVRVPDPYPFPTIPMHLKTSLSLVSDSNGLVSLVVFPNPLVSFCDPGVLALGSGSTALVSGSGKGGCKPLDGASAVYGISSTSLFNTLYASYRVVAGGLCIRNQQAQLSAKGRLYVACFPMTQEAYDPAVLGAVTLTNGGLITLLANLGLGSNAISPANQELPVSAVINVSDLLRKDYTASFPIYDQAAFYTFKETSFGGTVAGGFLIGSEALVATATNTTTYVGSSSISSSAGGCGFVIYGDNFPASTTILEMDLIYHMESTPTLASTQSSNVGIPPVVIANNIASVGTTQVVETVNNAVTKAGPFTATTSDPELPDTLGITKILDTGVNVLESATKIAGLAAAFL